MNKDLPLATCFTKVFREGNARDKPGRSDPATKRSEMNLDNETHARVTAMFGGKYSHAEYNGCWSSNTVSFLLCNKDQDGNYKSGVMVTLTQDFKITRVERMGLIRSTGMRNRPTERIQIPIL